ncbi:leucine-rich repeat-containing protein [Plakobranchus ocellatus]|uniref:Leucine-rich repeat-containing protein n=1 Tax=Plakobranchus ocellatus TaxID=259542 RepID=A0AAV4D698_9GAST|nr:leucine-rich repeat-containing protein [Plakobranchus ocellatus]
MAAAYDDTSYSSSSSDSEYSREHLEDLSYGNLDTIPECTLQRTNSIHSLQLDNNDITSLPCSIGLFKKLIVLDISSNKMTFIPDEICQLTKMRTLIAKNNHLTTASFPKGLSSLKSLEVLNVSGNHLEIFPTQFTLLEKLQVLHIGGNVLKKLPSSIKALSKLEVLYLGGNCLSEIPAEVGNLEMLTSLVLCDNRLQSLPPTLINLHRLRSLSLHNNQLSTLPTEIVALNLVELSLRNNPLVNRFVEDLVYNPPSLMELAGRVIKIEKIVYTEEDLPRCLVSYLDSAQRCVNPKCKGVYFSSRVEQVKFVDFCGKYRLPLLQYLCSPNCSAASPSVCASSESEDEEGSAMSRMRRVLLG